MAEFKRCPGSGLLRSAWILPPDGRDPLIPEAESWSIDLHVVVRNTCPGQLCYPAKPRAGVYHARPIHPSIRIEGYMTK
ncbi:MAG: hypothetical protein BGP25_09590 [Lysobacterales bacterium 63-13]|nr:MAG: hypothetical protein BGP25_09590 [Xanthomonadales bacterium 63-13]